MARHGTRGRALLLAAGLALALASGLVACDGSADGDSPPGVPGEPAARTAPAPPTETAQLPVVTPDPLAGRGDPPPPPATATPPASHIRDPIPVMQSQEPVTGPATVWLDAGSFVVLTIPAGITVFHDGVWLADLPLDPSLAWWGGAYVILTDERSGATLVIDHKTGRELERGVPARSRTMHALFDQIIASVRTDVSTTLRLNVNRP